MTDIVGTAARIAQAARRPRKNPRRPDAGDAQKEEADRERWAWARRIKNASWSSVRNWFLRRRLVDLAACRRRRHPPRRRQPVQDHVLDHDADRHRGDVLVAAGCGVVDVCLPHMGVFS